MLTKNKENQSSIKLFLKNHSITRDFKFKRFYQIINNQTMKNLKGNDIHFQVSCPKVFTRIIRLKCNIKSLASINTLIFQVKMIF
jgi:hypothetical protein